MSELVYDSGIRDRNNACHLVLTAKIFKSVGSQPFTSSIVVIFNALKVNCVALRCDAGRPTWTVLQPKFFFFLKPGRIDHQRPACLNRNTIRQSQNPRLGVPALV